MMKYIFKPSLQHTVAVKIAVALWNQNDIRVLIEELSFLMHIFSHKWQTIEEKVTEKVQQLPLPDPLREQILGYIKPIGLQIVKWIKYHHPYYPCYALHLPSKFCWSPEGTIDWKETAKLLVKEKKIDILKFYELIYEHCLEVSTLSNSAPISNENVFKHSAKTGHKIATEYFFHKLSTSEKATSLVETAKSVSDSEVMYFLLLQMDEEQQMEVFKSSPCLVLLCFLTWPFQSAFLEIANQVWGFLFDMDYCYILAKLIYKIQDGYKDSNYQYLFRRIWQKCPERSKSILIDGYNVLSFLFKFKDQENLKLVLQDATAVQKEKFIYSGSVIENFQEFIWDNESDLLEFVTQECLPSKYEAENFKRKFKKHLKLGDGSN